MKSQHNGARSHKDALSAFLFGTVAISLVGLSSCGSSNTSTNNGNVATAPTNSSSSPTPTPALPTVTRLDQTTVGSTTNFQAPNGKVFKVVFREAEPEFSAPATGPDSNTAAHASHNHVCDGEAFDGSDRKASKTKPSDAQVEEFANLSDFINTLAPDDEMGNHQPEINTGPTSTRVSEEKRNVHIAQAWLYTFSRESDEDYHVIIGTTPDKGTAKFFNVEISGLPGHSSNAFAELNEARNTFKDFFGLAQCAGGYTADMMDNPQEIEVTGSPFFDKLHFDGHASIGPEYARSTSYWEIHPVTSIVFK